VILDKILLLDWTLPREGTRSRIDIIGIQHLCFHYLTSAFSLYFYLFFLFSVSLLLLSPTLSNYLITMNNIIANTQNTALSEIVAKLQQAALYEISQLNLPRQQVLEIEVQLWVPNLEALFDGYVNQDICQLSQNFKLSKAIIYFPPKYRQALYYAIRRAAQDGADSLTLWGKGRGKDQSMYIRCHCAPLYRGSKTDKQGSVVPGKDYRATTYTNNPVRINNTV
jgi:hypothetical protein